MIKRIIAVFAALLALTTAALAQGDPIAARETEIATTDRALSTMRAEVEAGAPDDIRIIETRMRDLLRGSRGRMAPVERDLRLANDALSQLGPAPAEGAPPESEPVALRRTELVSQVSELQGQRTRIQANIDSAGELLTEVSARRLAFLYAGFIERGPSVGSPALLRAASSQGAELIEHTGRYFSRWSAEKREQDALFSSVALIVAALIVSVLLFGPAHVWMRRRFTTRLEAMDPTPARRVTVAGVKMLARLVTGVIGGVALLEASRVAGLLRSEGLPVAQAVWFALVAFLIAEGFASGLFAPQNPSWRIAAVGAEKGRRAGVLLLALVAVFGVKMVLAAIAQTAGAQTAGDFEAFIHLTEALAAIVVGALLFLLCRRRLWTGDGAVSAGTAEAAGAEAGRWTFIRRLGQVVAILTIGAAAIGYVRLADFAASRLYFLALILALVWFLRAALRELAAWGQKRIRKSGSDEDGSELLRFWFGAGIDISLFLALAPALLVLAGLSWRSVRDIVFQAFLAFRVGGITISISDILIALLVFFAILAATRFAQRGLERGVFAHSRVDPGVQNSLTTLLGYVGLLIALVVGVTAMGIDLSNLALIAGALSVGVGFGLQSIVNNFVSGLILLFERPIKVGDWIITQSGEGTVKRIGVRSTDIETFDRSSIIVPNSELVTQTVTNWTHKDRIGRITVPVGVSYSSDAEKVRAILLKCAEDHPLVVRYPEPFVVFRDFADSALNFELRCFLRDISTGIQARTDLRFAILKAFREAGVEIPFPQRDVHVRSLPETPGAAPPAPSPVGPAPERPKYEPEIAEDE